MITQNDLNKIKTVVEEVFDRKFDEKFDQKFDEKFDQKFGENFDRKFDEKFDQKFGENFDRKVKPINKQLRKIQKDLTTTINYFDHSLVNHENRIRTIEHHTNLQQNI